MTDLAEATTDIGEAKSTTLEENASPGVSGAGAPKIEPEVKEPASLRDTIADEVKKESQAKEKTADDADAAKGADGDKDGAAKDEKAKDAKSDAKPEEKAKDEPDNVKPEKKPPERDDTGKFKANTAPVNDTAEKDGDDKSGHYQAPKNFLPDAREKWLNVPRPVQRDIDNMAREHEARIEQLSKATERYESLRQFDELAQSNGRDLTESLAKLNQIENLMQSNPYAGLNAILQEIGPRKPDGSPVSLFEVSQFIAQQGPEKWQQMVQVRYPANEQPQEDPEVVQLKQQIAQMQVQHTAQSVIEPFKAQHPRYEELKGPIAQILNSGMVPASLSPPDRLAAAYDMAERLNPPSNVDKPAPAPSPDADGRADPDLSGTKSIKSAPGSSSPDLAPERGGSIAEILRDETRRNRRA